MSKELDFLAHFPLLKFELRLCAAFASFYFYLVLVGVRVILELIKIEEGCEGKSILGQVILDVVPLCVLLFQRLLHSRDSLFEVPDSIIDPLQLQMYRSDLPTGSLTIEVEPLIVSQLILKEVERDVALADNIIGAKDILEGDEDFQIFLASRDIKCEFLIPNWFHGVILSLPGSRFTFLTLNSHDDDGVTLRLTFLLRHS